MQFYPSWINSCPKLQINFEQLAGMSLVAIYSIALSRTQNRWENNADEWRQDHPSTHRW